MPRVNVIHPEITENLQPETLAQMANELAKQIDSATDHDPINIWIHAFEDLCEEIDVRMGGEWRIANVTPYESGQ